MFGWNTCLADILLNEGWWRVGNQLIVMEPLSLFAMIDRPFFHRRVTTNSSVGPRASMQDGYGHGNLLPGTFKYSKNEYHRHRYFEKMV